MNFSDIVEQKRALQDILVSIIVSYCRKYIVKHYTTLDLEESGSSKVLRSFQKDLTYISAWSDSRVNKEYSKFSKWCLKKRGITEQEMENMFTSVIELSTQILVNTKINTDVSLKDLFFKSMKRVARFYYEDPREVMSKDVVHEITARIESLLHTFVPIQEVMDLIRANEERNSYNSYDFDKQEASTKESESRRGLVVQKERTNSDDGHGLRYIGSEEFYKEYYHSDEEEVPVESNASDEKQINVPIIRKLRVKR
jgi:hypothetical protein